MLWGIEMSMFYCSAANTVLKAASSHELGVGLMTWLQAVANRPIIGFLRNSNQAAIAMLMRFQPMPCRKAQA